MNVINPINPLPVFVTLGLIPKNEAQAHIKMLNGEPQVQTLEITNPNWDESLIKRDAGGRFAKKSASSIPPATPPAEPPPDKGLPPMDELDARRREAIMQDLNRRYNEEGIMTTEEYEYLTKLMDFHFKLKDRINEPEDVAKVLKEDFGFEGEINVVEDIGSTFVGMVDKIFGQNITAYYSNFTNNMTISKGTFEALKDGSLEAYEIVAHESLHAKQSEWEDDDMRHLDPLQLSLAGKKVPFEALNPIIGKRMAQHVEGMNQLMTLAQIGRKSGAPLEIYSIDQASRMISESRYVKPREVGTYWDETLNAAILVKDIARVEGKTTTEVLNDMHSKGADFIYQQKKINEVYNGYYFPRPKDYKHQQGYNTYFQARMLAEIVNEY